MKMDVLGMFRKLTSKKLLVCALFIFLTFITTFKVDFCNEDDYIIPCVNISNEKL